MDQKELKCIAYKLVFTIDGESKLDFLCMVQKANEVDEGTNVHLRCTRYNSNIYCDESKICSLH